MSSRWNLRVATWAKVFVATILVGSFAAVTATSASATTTVTLYVNASESGMTCIDSTTNACPALQDAITVAETYSNTDVTIDVAAGSYTENDSINLPATDSLTIQGASSSSTLFYPVLSDTSDSVLTISTGGPVIIDDLTIEDATKRATFSSSNLTGESFGGAIDNAGGSLTVNDSTFLDDSASGASTSNSYGGDAYGGAIFDTSGELLVSGDTFVSDYASGGAGNGTFGGGLGAGGAIYVEGGTLYGEFDTFSDDAAYGAAGGTSGDDASGYSGGASAGGAVFSNATSTSFYLSTFSGDGALGGEGGDTAVNGGIGGPGGSAYGGALFIANTVTGASTITLTKDTIATNSAQGGLGGLGHVLGTGGSSFGGGIYDGASSTTTTTLTDDTLTQDGTIGADSADSFGGAIYNSASTTTALNVTLASNYVGGTGSDEGAGVADGGTFTFENSILDQTQSCWTSGGSIDDGGYNVESDDTCGFLTSVVGSAGINLATTLAANGSTGPETLAIDPTSSAYEEVPSSACTYGYDQRGEPRPGITGANCDAGAFEFQGYSVTYDSYTVHGVGPSDPTHYGPGENAAVLFNPPPTLTNFAFGGWCTVPEPVDTACSGTEFPNKTFPVTGLTVGNANVVLYALWDTPTTLYVNANESGTTCIDASTNACPSIQDAIDVAQGLHNTAVTIDVAAGTYDESDVIDLTNNDVVTIVGAGDNDTSLSSGFSGSDITIDQGLVTIQNLTIEDGNHLSGGGGVLNYGALIADDDTFSSNRGALGGAILNDGTLIADDDTFDGNSGEYGGAIDNESNGYLTATNDTFTENSVIASGGAIYDDSSLTATSTTPPYFTFYENAATLTSDTFYDDTAKSGGDALGDQGSPVTISDSILDEMNASGSCTMGNFPYSPDGGNNVESDDTCGFSTSVVDNAGINLATTLAANGSTGPETLAIDPTSSAYQEVPLASCALTTDERGDIRPGAGAQCDAGAFEYQTPATPPSPPSSKSLSNVTVSFVSDGGSSVSNLSGTSGANVTLPAAPTFAGHTFSGWFTQASGGALVGLAGATYVLSTATTLYAQWTTNPVPAVVVLLGKVHPFATGSSTLSKQLRDQVAAFERVIRGRHYANVSLEGEVSLRVSSTNRHLALARAVSVEAYLKAHGLRNVHFTLSAKVGGTSEANVVVVEASA